MAYPYWAQPIPPQYDWGTASFQTLTNYAAQQPAAYAYANPDGSLRVAPIVATYSTLAQKRSCINGALPQDQAQYAGGAVVGAATRYFPAGNGGVGMVTSPMQTAAQASATGANEWHTVGVLRQGGSVWIHDPGYTIDSQIRLPQIPGTSNVTRLLGSNGFGNVNQVQVQGFGSTNAECMGRSAQWVDNVLGVVDATAPFPSNTFVAGQVCAGWQVVQQY